MEGDTILSMEKSFRSLMEKSFVFPREETFCLFYGEDLPLSDGKVIRLFYGDDLFYREVYCIFYGDILPLFFGEILRISLEKSFISYMDGRLRFTEKPSASFMEKSFVFEPISEEKDPVRKDLC